MTKPILTLDEQIALAERAIAALEAMTPKTDADKRGIAKTLATWKAKLETLKEAKRCQG